MAGEGSSTGIVVVVDVDEGASDVAVVVAGGIVVRVEGVADSSTSGDVHAAARSSVAITNRDVITAISRTASHLTA
jgi:hypothetical protein